jgi:hypothetical protein
MNKILTFFFRCRHEHRTFPQTRDGKTTCCCLDCGKEYIYDWREMRLVEDKAA